MTDATDPAHDIDRWPEIVERAATYARSVLSGLDERPPSPGTVHVAPEPLRVDGVGIEGALADFDRRFAPAMTGGAGPRYLGFVTGGTTPAALVGDWLTSAFDQNAGPGGEGSAAAAIEDETLRWLRTAFGLGDDHSGSFVSGATMSNLVGLAAGREWSADRVGVSVAADGAAALGPVAVLSGTPHSSVVKAMSVLGFGRSALRRVATLPGREAVDVDALADALDRTPDGPPPIVVANAGTVDTGDVDDLVAIAALRGRRPFWLHVDAAFGGFAALSPAAAPLVAGLDLADSVCVDLHKWLNVPYDSAVQFGRRPDLQARLFRNDAPYLATSDARPGYAHLTPETSRRLRALAAWFTLDAYGLSGHRAIVERSLRSARDLHERLTADGRVRSLAEPRLNILCVTLAHDPSPARVTAWLSAVNASGAVFLTPTVLDGVPAVRAAFSGWRTGPDDVEGVAAAMLDALPRSGDRPRP